MIPSRTSAPKFLIIKLRTPLSRSEFSGSLGRGAVWGVPSTTIRRRTHFTGKKIDQKTRYDVKTGKYGEIVPPRLSTHDTPETRKFT